MRLLGILDKLFRWHRGAKQHCTSFKRENGEDSHRKLVPARSSQADEDTFILLQSVKYSRRQVSGHHSPHF